MKKIIIIICLAMVVLLGGTIFFLINKEPLQDMKTPSSAKAIRNYFKEIDFTAQDIICSSEEASMVSESGYYYTGDLMTLKYLDKETGESIFVCNKPDCTHGSKDCNASFNGDMITHMFYYGDLLFVRVDSDTTCTLYVEHKDGSNRIKLLENEGRLSLYSFQIIDGVMYYVIEDEEPENIIEVETREYIWANHTLKIARLNLETGKNEILYELENNEQEYCVNYKMCKGTYTDKENLCFLKMYSTEVVFLDGDSDIEAIKEYYSKQRCEIYTYNIKEGSAKRIGTLDNASISDAWVYKNTLYCSIYSYADISGEKSSIVTVDLDTGENNTIIKVLADEGSFIFTDNKIWIGTVGQTPKLWYYDMEKQELFLSKGKAGKDAYSVICASGKYNLIGYDKTDYKGQTSGTYTSNPTTYAIEEEDIFLDSQYDVYQGGYEADLEYNKGE